MITYLVPPTGSLLAQESDALDIMGKAFGQQAELVVIPIERLSPDFFRLSTGLAGAILQKFTNYQLRVAIVGLGKIARDQHLPAIAATESVELAAVVSRNAPSQVAQRAQLNRETCDKLVACRCDAFLVRSIPV